jgi:ubiquitin conjugation factor E4 B
LDALVGPRCNDLRVENKEKYHFNPRQLLSDVVQVYLNLDDQDVFIRAVAGDGRSYKKELFEYAAKICSKNGLKSPAEAEELMLFVGKVEEAKVVLEAEEDLGEVPDEFLGTFPTVSLIDLRSEFRRRSSCRPTDVHGHARSGSPTHFTNYH